MTNTRTGVFHTGFQNVNDSTGTQPIGLRQRCLLQKKNHHNIEDMLLLLIQQKLNNLMLDERSGLRKRTAYTPYSDPQGIIYADWNNRNRLMRIDELQKFSDGTLIDVQSALQDISSGLRMDYLPKKHWSNFEK
ncbi:hypothetical protein Tco_0187954 [Tanacetum coccineum]